VHDGVSKCGKIAAITLRNIRTFAPATGGCRFVFGNRGYSARPPRRSSEPHRTAAERRCRDVQAQPFAEDLNFPVEDRAVHIAICQELFEPVRGLC